MIKKRNAYYLFMMVLLCTPKSFIDIGIKISEEDLAKSKDNSFLMISPASIQQQYRTTIMDVVFAYCIDKNNKIIYLQTSDTSFVTDRGLCVGDRISKYKYFNKKGIVYLPGWSYYLPLKSGWNAAIGLQDDYDTLDVENAVIRWFFKRKR